MPDILGFTEIYGQHVELLPGRTMLTAGARGAPTPAGDLNAAAATDVSDDFGDDITGDGTGVDDDGAGGAPDDGGSDYDGGVDDDGPGGVRDDGGYDANGGVDDDGDEDGDGVR